MPCVQPSAFLGHVLLKLLLGGAYFLIDDLFGGA